ncbi:Unknown protein sequence [Pseudomonas amygdali pv. morsprunorum]|nr:Unknown protein sequence [Pseudomonas amygdali pv. morsprunorum]
MHPCGPLVSARLAINVDQPGRPDHIHGGVIQHHAGAVPACDCSGSDAHWQCPQGRAAFTRCLAHDFSCLALVRIEGFAL